MTKSLQNKRIVVTGGGSGIGAGIAEVVTFAADVTDRAATEAAIDAANKAMSGLDGLVNNAGIGGPNGCALPGPDRFEEILRTNVDGVFHCSRAACKHLSDGGRIVSISSVLGRFGVPGYTAYCASKHAVIGMMKALALELAERRITVNTICPGWVDTSMAKQGMELLAETMGTSYADARKAALSAVPLGRILQPREVGELTAWLCSDAASGMTGQAITHDGGQVMW